MENIKDLLSIGELSRLCYVPVKTLRYYDKIGILKPVFVDPSNQYRYYSVSQIPYIIAIRMKKMVGSSLLEIKKFLEIKEQLSDMDKLMAFTSLKEAEINKQLETMLRIKEQITSWKEFYKKAKLLDGNKCDNEIKLRHIPPRTVAFTRFHARYDDDISLLQRFSELTKIADENNLYVVPPTMSILHSDRTGHHTSEMEVEVCFNVLGEDNFDFPFIREIPGGLYACSFYRGDYLTLINEISPRLVKWLKEQDYRMAGPIVYAYLITFVMVTSPDRLVTEVQIRVEK
ncbi:MAG: MerR family transcriptional regulator [Eubacteriales bacterium]